MPSDRWNVSAFAKYYRQYNKGPVSQNTDGIGNYINLSNTASALGYGAAGTYFIWKDLQVKLSYERLSACRPRTNSLEMKTLKLAK